MAAFMLLTKIIDGIIQIKSTTYFNYFGLVKFTPTDHHHAVGCRRAGDRGSRGVAPQLDQVEISNGV
jgi:hypothetical protein